MNAAPFPRLALLAVFAWCACAPRPPAELVVIAAHPDDEALMAAGLMRRTLEAGRRVAVVVLTDGDYGCFEDRDATVRRRETLAAMTAVGVAAADVHLLGYPDGHLDRLRETPLGPVPHRAADGSCTTKERTANGRPFTSTALTHELAALLDRLAPSEVVVPHPLDSHSDHAAAYAFFRRALERLDRAPLKVRRAVVHQGRCWPADCVAPYRPDARVPSLPAPFAAYAPTDSVPVNGRWKFQVLERYATQLAPSPVDDWLSGFARREEVFWTEQLTRHADGRWHRSTGEERRLGGGAADGGVVVREGDEVLATLPLGAASGPLVLRLEPEPGGYRQLSLWSGRTFEAATVVPAASGP